MALPIDDRPAFERQPGEPVRAYHGFCHFRDGGAGTSIDKAWRHHRTTCDHIGLSEVSNRRRPTSWAVWSVRWRWLERAAAHQAYLDEQKRAAFEGEQIAAAQRHARTLQAAISANTIALRVALEAAASPTGLETLKTAALASAGGLRAALADARLAASTLPALVQAERLTLHMSTDIHEVKQSPTFDPIAAKIVSDPAAAAAAVELLNLIAERG